MQIGLPLKIREVGGVGLRKDRRETISFDRFSRALDAPVSPRDSAFVITNSSRYSFSLSLSLELIFDY